ncbi:MAG: DUF4114 domain-containing protein [Nodosilinea sp.]
MNIALTVPRLPQPCPLAAVLLLATVSGMTLAPTARAIPNIQLDADGAVHIDNNAFDLSTGDLENSSNVPLPDGLIQQRHNTQAQPVRADQLAPNTLEIRVDTDNVNQQLQPLAPGFQIHNDSLELTTQFDLQYLVGNHDYGEGIQVTVYGPDGAVKTTETAFVRGALVRIGPDGEILPESAQINARFNAEDTVELRVLNLQQDGSQPLESGIYFTNDGQFAVEDLPNGGDLDFNDGGYFNQSAGRGTAQIESETQTVSDTISFRTEVVETPLDPLLRQEQVATEARQQTEQTLTDVTEERRSGQIEVLNPGGATLPHAYGASTANAEHLVYDQYVGTSQVRVGSDGASLIGQFSPLAGNPAAAPTLITGTLRVNPFADNNQSGLEGTVGITQFITPTHEDATDMFGVVVVNPDPQGPRLIQPTGLFTDTNLTGYVPPIPAQVVAGQPLASVNGIFELPTDQAIVIAPVDPTRVGPGNAAFTRNVGGLVIEKIDGSREFVPQWNAQGYLTEPIILAAGTANRVIYALVPQQANQDLQLGQAYALAENSGAIGGVPDYRTVAGEFRVIAADLHPQNFNLEQADIYAVEDTLSAGNFAVPAFNGVQGLHRQAPGGEPVATVDVADPENVDARVGNQLSTQEVVLPGVAGQSAYLNTARAAAFYVRGGFTLGVGNQEDTIVTTTSTFLNQTDAVFRQTTTNTFATPRTQVDTSTTEITTQVTENTRQTGNVDFDISPDGLLTNTNVQMNAPEVTRQAEIPLEGPTTVDSTVRLGEEALVGSTVEAVEMVEVISSQTTLIDQQVATSTQTTPNVSPLIGEFAVGGVLNLGNTPWTPAANTLRLEAFVRGSVLGQGLDSGNFGWRAEAVFNPFGEQQRPAHTFDLTGNLVPVYQTQPLVNENGEPVFSELADASGQPIQVATHEFVQTEAGERVVQMVGTGRAIGPGVYLRVEDVFDSREGLAVIGGLEFDL